MVVLVVEGIYSYRRTALRRCEEGSERVVWGCRSGECAQKSRRRARNVCALCIRYACEKVECLASVDTVLIGRRWGVRLASSYPVAGGRA